MSLSRWIVSTVFRMFQSVTSQCSTHLKLLGLSFLSVSLLPQAFAGPSSLEQITLKHGLSQSTVFSITQDDTGFMWMGTRNGLNRFDGYDFRHFMAEQGLPSSFIWSLTRDANDTLWMGTQGAGLVQRDERGQFVAHPNGPKVVVDIKVSRNNNRDAGLWVASQDKGLQFFNTRQKTFTPYSQGVSSAVWSVQEDSDNNIWIGTAGQGLSRFNQTTQAWQHFRHDQDNPNSISSNKVWKVIEDSRGHIWAATFGGGLNKLDASNGEFIHHQHDPENPKSLSNNYVWTLMEDSRGRLWVGTNGGLNLFDAVSGKFHRFLNTREIKSLYEDDAGIIWVGTYYGGVYKLDEKRNKFQLISDQPVNSVALASSTVNDIYESPDKVLWVASDSGGLNRISSDKKQITHYLHNPIDPTSISNNHAMTIAPTYTGDFLIGTYSGGLNRFNPTTEEFTRYRHEPGNPNGLNDDSVFDILQDQKNRIWLATWRGGLNQYHPETDTFSHYTADSNNPDAIGDNYLQVLFEDNQQRLWIGTASAGLERFIPEEKKFIHYKHDPADPKSISHNHIYAIQQADNNRLWIGTESGGLNLFDPATGHTQHFMDKGGYLNTAILGIQEDSLQNLWISTRNGLLRYNIPLNTAYRYDEGDGVQSTEFISGSQFKSSDGHLYFGGVGGLNFFRPEHVEHNRFIPPVVITKLEVLNEQRNRLINLDNHQHDDLNDHPSITLDYEDQPFSLEFAALNYTRSELNRYSYKLDGIDNTWIKDSTRRHVVYHQLAPGSYTFQVKGTNNDGVWNETPTRLQIDILAPWWLSPWAYLVYFSSVGILLWFYWSWRKRTQKAELERDIAQRSEYAKQNFLAKMSHEIRTPLSGMLGMGLLLERTRLDTSQQRYIHSLLSAGNALLNIINDILDFSKIEAQKVELAEKPFNLKLLIDELLELFHIETIRRQLTLQQQYDPSLPERFIGDSVRLRQVLSNLIGNAVKFTEEGGVWVNVSGEAINDVSAKLIIEIKDSGIGIEEKKLRSVYDQFIQADADIQQKYGGTGLGLSIAQQLTQLMNGKLDISSQHGIGTTARIEINLPLAGNRDDAQNESDESVEYRYNARVLIVEDNEINSLALSRLLADIGCKTIEVRDGIEALAYLEDHEVDLIFMDRHMPNMNGIKATREIRRQPHWETLPIVALTASVSLQDKIDCLDAGMNEYLLKPLLPEKALSVISKYCHQCRRAVKPSDLDNDNLDKQSNL